MILILIGFGCIIGRMLIGGSVVCGRNRKLKSLGVCVVGNGGGVGYVYYLYMLFWIY